MLREVKCVQAKTRLIPIRIDGSAVAGGTDTTDGILEGSSHCTITENSSGNYTITFLVPFYRTPVVTSMTATDVTALRIVAVDNESVQIEQVADDLTTPVADGDFHLLVLGFDSEDET